MLLLLLAGIYAAVLPLGWGVWLAQLVRASLGLADDQPPLKPLLLWLGGLLLLTVVLEVASLLGPLHTLAHLGALAVGAAGLGQVAGRRVLAQLWAGWRQWPALVRGLAALLVVYVLFLSAMPTPSLETAMYHAQSLRWLEEMGIVPGLANVNIHIGFNSAWFVPEALFSWGRYLGSPLQVLNGVFYVYFGCYCLSGLARLRRRQVRLTDVLRLLLLLCVSQISVDLASLSSDPAVTLLLCFLLLEALEPPLPAARQPLRPAQVVATLLCVFVLTLKLSALPVLLLPLWWLWRSGQWRVGRVLLGLAGLSALVLAPWLARNVLLSGYLVFPVALDLFHVSWKFPLVELRLHADYIQEFARSYMDFKKVKTVGTPFAYWVPQWWQHQLSISKAVLLVIAGLLPVSLPLAWWQQRRRPLPGATQLAVVLVVVLAGGGFWFVLAPTFRFGNGFLFPLLALLLLPWLGPVARAAPRLLSAAGVLVFLGLLVLTPLLMHLRHYVVPDFLPRADYNSLLARLPDPADRAVLRRDYTPAVPARADTLMLRPVTPLAHAHLVMLLSRVGGVYNSGFDTTGRGGIFGWSGRLLYPAAYPVVPVSPLRLGQLVVLQTENNIAPWYAPFPFVSRRHLCQANGPRLRDGFRARVLPLRTASQWYQEGVW